jgi:hypothetical protein
MLPSGDGIRWAVIWMYRRRWRRAIGLAARRVAARSTLTGVVVVPGGALMRATTGEVERVVRSSEARTSKVIDVPPGTTEV